MRRLSGIISACWSQAVACVLDVDGDDVVKKVIEQRSGDDRMAEEVTPFGEAAV
jgi:hypothetical protein